MVGDVDGAGEADDALGLAGTETLALDAVALALVMGVVDVGLVLVPEQADSGSASAARNSAARRAGAKEA